MEAARTCLCTDELLPAIDVEGRAGEDAIGHDL
jgi:hypothetical protein